MDQMFFDELTKDWETPDPPAIQQPKQFTWELELAAKAKDIFGIDLDAPVAVDEDEFTATYHVGGGVLMSLTDFAGPGLNVAFDRRVDRSSPTFTENWTDGTRSWFKQMWENAKATIKRDAFLADIAAQQPPCPTDPVLEYYGYSAENIRSKSYLSFRVHPFFLRVFIADGHTGNMVTAKNELNGDGMTPLGAIHAILEGKPLLYGGYLLNTMASEQQHIRAVALSRVESKDGKEPLVTAALSLRLGTVGVDGISEAQRCMADLRLLTGYYLEVSDWVTTYALAAGIGRAEAVKQLYP